MEDSITVRRMSFEFGDEMKLIFIDDDPQLSFVFLGAWMLLPYLEPYLMRTMREAMKVVDDENLKHDMQLFCSQEGQHYQQHAIANTRIMTMLPDSTRRQVEDKLEDAEQQYRAFFEERPLAWNLAYAEGFEAYTCAGARAQMSVNFFEHMHNPIRDLMLWHIMEEMEHRTVAFDAYEAVVGDYFFRLRIGLWAQHHFVSLGREFSRLLTSGFPDLIRAHDTPAARKRRKTRRGPLTRKTLANLAGIYHPRYSPRALSLPALYERTRAEYDQRVQGIA